MKKLTLLLVMGIILLLGFMGCGEALPNDQVESGVTDQTYQGDPAPVLDAQYLQSEEERMRYEEFANDAKEQDEEQDEEQNDETEGKGFV